MAQSLDPINFFLQMLTTFPINVIIIGAIVAYILYYLMSSRKPEEEKFKVEDFRESVIEFHEKLMNAFGIATNSFLVRGIELQGKIDKWYPLRQKMPKYKISEKDKKLIEEKKKKPVYVIDDKDRDMKEAKAVKTNEIDAIIFQIGRKSFWSFITGHKPKFVLIERKALTYDANSKKWAMDESVSLMPYAGIFIASEKSEKWINNISYMRSQEEVLTYSQNFARKTAWLELAHVKLMDYALGKEDKKRAGWEGFRRKALGYEEEELDD